MAGSKAKSKKPKAAADGPPDLRSHLEPTAKNLEATLVELEAVVGKLTPPEVQQPTELVEAMVHQILTAGVPCGIGQAARARIAVDFVDRNEFRLTEAFELEELLGDLGIPEAFERCDRIIQAIRQIYNEQNSVTLEFLRDAQVGDRNTFLQRAVAIPTEASRFITHILSFEELLFSDRSTQRVQQRLNLDAKVPHVEAFLTRAAVMLKPFGCLPLDVAPPRNDRTPHLVPTLSPACLLVRLAPAGKR